MEQKPARRDLALIAIEQLLIEDLLSLVPVAKKEAFIKYWLETHSSQFQQIRNEIESYYEGQRWNPPALF